MRLVVKSLIALMAAAAVSRAAAAQGLAGAAVQGTVMAQSRAVSGASVTLKNDSTGNVFRAVTSERGAFRFDNLPVVGSFTLEVRAIGYRPSTTRGLVLHLGDRLPLDISLDASPQALESVRVEARRETRDAGAGAPAQNISGDAARELPLLNRDFVGLFLLSSQATGSPAPSIGGQNSRLNAIQVDGATAGDRFGVNVTTGAGNGARSLPLDAIQEIQILLSPFDVRYGGFSGGLINAVTRSGTNDRTSSVSATVSASDLVGDDPGAGAPSRFTSAQYAASAGGPIVHDRLQYFASAELQREQGPPVSTASVNDSLARRVAEISRDVYGFDPGGTEAPTLRNPTWNAFGKLTWQASSQHLVDLSVNALGAQADALGRSSTTMANRNGWALSNSGSIGRTAATTVRARVASGFGSASNELVASASTTSDWQDSQSAVPLFLVATDPIAANYVAAGSFSSAEGTRTDQRSLEVTDNVSWTLGRHVLTFGAQGQQLRFHDNILVNSRGVWTFPSVDAYAEGAPSRYEVLISQRPGTPLANYSSRIFAGYAQDRWAISPRLTVTAGLRVDVPTFDRPLRDTLLAKDAALDSIDTSIFPSGNAVWSPRAGFSFVSGRAEHPWVVRGGAGVFSGTPPYTWMTNAYSATGMDATTLICAANVDPVPPPVTNVAMLPTTCSPSGVGGRVPVPTVTTFAPNTRFPATLKLGLGIEHDIGGGLVASIDAMVARTRNSLTLVDDNLVPRGTDGEGRVMYGTILPTGASKPARLDSSAFGPVYRFENVSGDRYSSLTLNASKRWTDSRWVQLGYTWSRTLDLNSFTGLSSTILFQNNPIEGSLDDRALSRSFRDVPHNFVAAGAAPIGFGVTASGILRATSGTPFAYIVGGSQNADANADGTSGNDLFYVPRTASDISLNSQGSSGGNGYAALDAYIAGEPCLASQRGRIMERNSCRNPSTWDLDARLAKSIRGFEISADVFDLPNLLYSRWGVTRATTSREGVPIVSVVGWDDANRRPVYKLTLPTRDNAVPGMSEWRIQLGVRQRF